MTFTQYQLFFLALLCALSWFQNGVDAEGSIAVKFAYNEKGECQNEDKSILHAIAADVAIHGGYVEGDVQDESRWLHKEIEDVPEDKEHDRRLRCDCYIGCQNGLPGWCECCPCCTEERRLRIGRALTDKRKADLEGYAEKLCKKAFKGKDSSCTTCEADVNEV